MRLIDHRKKKSKKRQSKKLFVLIIVFGVAGVIGWLLFKQSTASSPGAEDSMLEVVSAPERIPDDYKVFSPEEFQQLYENITYPNTTYLDKPPSITGNEIADQRIRTIAESRGYVLRSAPVASIFKADDPRLSAGKDDLLQEKALQSWKELEQAAIAENIPLKLNSGYRSVEFQREIFLSRLNATGATASTIAAGQSDNLVLSVLKEAALPGYSRHHTGYTVDFVCGNGVQSFKVTTCFEWLKADNYLNAKKHGWIPSYPEGVQDQGPEPEPWEYVWVSKEALWKEAN